MTHKEPPVRIKEADLFDLPELTEEQIERGRLLFARNTEFMLGVVGLEQLPMLDWPEFAFAGRSNVGKSSLINALTGRKNLARTSNTPGRTQELNFFSLDSRAALVDLPGYGYAKVSRKQVHTWTDMLLQYLIGRVELSRVCLLIDGRHGIKTNDEEVMDMLDKAAVNYQIILTKCDKTSQKEQDKLIAKIRTSFKKHPAAHPRVICTSSAKGYGIAELRAELATIVADAEAR